MNAYRIVMRSCGAVAALGAVVYIMSLIFTGIDGPGGIEMPDQFGVVTISITVLCGIVALAGWMIRSDNKASAQRDIRPLIAVETDRAAKQVAAEVTLAVAGVLEQQLVRYAEQTAERSRTAVISAVRQMLDDQAEVIENAVSRAHTRGMIAAEVNSRANGGGNVASLSSRRDT